MAVTQTNLMTMPVPNLMADGTPYLQNLTDLNPPVLPSKPAPAGTMWMLNPNSNEYELVANPDWKPEQMNSAPSGMFAQTNLSQAPQFTVGQQPQQPSIVSGLFGDEIGVKAQQSQYLQDRQNAMQAQALQFAQLDPMARAQYALYLGGQQLGGAVGGALGAQDPQLQLIAQRSAITSQIDMNDPDSIFKAATRAVQIGDTPYANALADRAKALREAQVKQLQEASTATKNLAEATKIKGETGAKEQAIKTLQETYKLDESTAIAVANNSDLLKTYLTPKTAQGFKLLETGKYTPESIALWSDNKGELEPIDKQTKTTSDFLSKAVELGFEANAKYGDYTTEQVGKINKALFDDQIKLATAKATNIRVGVDVKGEEAFAKGLGELDAKAVGAARDKRDNSIAALGSLKQLNALNQNDLISGSFASGRVGATNFLASLNLVSGKDVDKLASSENYQKVAGDVILSTLGGRLGAGFSNDDRKFIQSLVPQLENSALARKQLIEFMINKNQDIVNETTRLEDYAREHKSLKGYIPTIPVINLQPSKPINQMSTQELLDLQKQLKK